MSTDFLTCWQRADELWMDKVAQATGMQVGGSLFLGRLMNITNVLYYKSGAGDPGEQNQLTALYCMLRFDAVLEGRFAEYKEAQRVGMAVIKLLAETKNMKDQGSIHRMRPTSMPDINEELIQLDGEQNESLQWRLILPLELYLNTA